MTFHILTGDRGQPGLPGLPGAYTVQIPHKIQKRDAGNLYLMVNLNIIHFHVPVTHHLTLFSSIAEKEVVGRHKPRRRRAIGV